MAFDGLFNVNLSQIILNSLQGRLAAFLGIFATSVSDDMALQGSAVDVPIVGAEGAANDLDGTASGDREHDEITPKFSTTKKTVTLAHKPARGFYLDPWEAAAVRNDRMDRALRLKIENCVGSVARSVIDGILNLIVSASFSNDKTVNVAAFDTDDVADLREQCDGINWGDADGSLVLGSSLWNTLGKDPSIKDKSQSGGANTLNTGMIPDVSGFSTYKNVRVPPSGGAAAAQNLVGFACLPSAIAVAMRPLTASQIAGMQAADFALADEMTITDPESQVVATVSIWGRPNTKRLYVCVETWWGATAAMGDQLVRLKTA